jgi:hypothetical protein
MGIGIPASRTGHAIPIGSGTQDMSRLHPSPTRVAGPWSVYPRDMSTADKRRWIIRLTWEAGADYPVETMWYGGRSGPRGPQVVKKREDAQTFDRFPDVVIEKEQLLAWAAADRVTIEEI